MELAACGGIGRGGDAAFVQDFCDRFDIPFHYGTAQVRAGKKGLEAAARDARYGFLKSLPGKIATAHTANDNAETVLMHMVRGTGLKGLGAIAPVNGKLIRPMLLVTRREVLAFLEEYNLCYVTDSSNGEDVFLRNRLRHHVMPLLKQENPKLAENISRMALRLRQDEAALDALVGGTLSGLVSTTVINGVRTSNPPANNGKTYTSKAEIMAIKDGAVRRAEMAKNPHLFGLTDN